MVYYRDITKDGEMRLEDIEKAQELITKTSDIIDTQRLQLIDLSNAIIAYANYLRSEIKRLQDES